MNRLFTFGCSFTQYWRWPTWADCVGHGRCHYENWGLCGAGNSYIVNSLIECNQRNRFTADDTILIMWTNTSREDRYVQDRWQQGGNVYWGTELGHDYLRKFACERGYLIRDLALISAAHDLLQHWGCRWRWFTMAPFERTNSDNHLGENPHMLPEPDLDVRDLYRDAMASMAPSVLDVVFSGSWFTGDGIPDGFDARRRDFHPTPREHVQYLDAVAPDLVTDQARDWMYQCDDRARANQLTWSEPHRPRVRL